MKEKIWGVLTVVFWIVVVIGGFWLIDTWEKSSDDSAASAVPAQTEEATPDPTGYTNCSAAHDDGVYDIPESSPAYKSRQDADHDGVACEHYLGN